MGVGQTYECVYPEQPLQALSSVVGIPHLFLFMTLFPQCSHFASEGKLVWAAVDMVPAILLGSVYLISKKLR